MSSLRLELVKILHQKRTYLGWIGLVLVPVIVIVAGALQKPHRPDPGEPPFVTHVSQNGLLVMLPSLYALASFLLPIIAAMGGASSVASEAEGGTLKTWLTRPVSRTRRAAHQVGDGRALRPGRRRCWWPSCLWSRASRPSACTRSSRCRARRSARGTPWR